MRKAYIEGSKILELVNRAMTYMFSPQMIV